MPVALSRREFLWSTAAAAITSPAANLAWSAPAEQDWSFPLLGDLHFDRLEHHDHEWLAREYPGDVSQVENYSRITRELTPRLLQRVRSGAKKLTDAGRSLPLILQLGDLLEGLCGNL